MSETKIKLVEKGWGEGATFFSINPNCSEYHRVDEIKEEIKQISDDFSISVYRGYKDGKLMFEMGASIDVTVTYQ